MFRGFYYQAHSEAVHPVIREAAAVTIAAVSLQALPAKVFQEAEDISAEAELQAAGKAKNYFMQSFESRTLCAGEIPPLALCRFRHKTRLRLTSLHGKVCNERIKQSYRLKASSFI